VLERAFERARRECRAAFIPYVMAGDPDRATTLEVLHALVQAGADAIELGVPYSDPLADGPTIVAAAQRALASQTTIPSVLELVRSYRANAHVPIVLFTYFNPVYQFGIDRFAVAAAQAGASAVIVPDVALDEGEELASAFEKCNLDRPLLVAPSTKPERMRRIAAASRGFIYVVSRLGVTGAGTRPSMDALRAQLRTLREITSKPLAVGFGVSAADHVRALSTLADGFVVGSALIDAYVGTRAKEAARRVSSFVAPLVAASGHANGKSSP
jgi:tryptophan synthase alpha chain